MERKKIISVFNRIESSIPVYSWKYGDIPLWPLIKKDVFFIKFHGSSRTNEILTTKHSSRLSRGLSYLRSLWNVLQIQLFYRGKRKVVFCGAYSHRAPWNGVLINRYFYPLSKDLSTKDFCEIEYGFRDKSQKYLDEDKILFVEAYQPFFRLLEKINTSSTMTLPKWSEFERIIEEELSVDISNYKKKLSARLKEIGAYIKLYDFLFGKIKPEVIYTLCYYNIAMFALNHWCYKNSVPVYDVQHGGQGPLHPMYFYSDYPKKGLSILPKYFWSWDEGSRKNIDNWLRDNLYHSSKFLGNTWLEFQIKNGNNRSFGGKKIILYTLQEKSLDAYIIETIKQTGEEYLWWLRLHPRMADAVNTIRKQLSIAGAMKYEVKIETSNDTPLPVLLKNAAVHISKFSGSIIEGIILKTPTVIIDPIGIDTYAHYIENGDAFPLYNPIASSLSDMLNKILN